MRNILIIWTKELRDTIRDKRTLLAMIVLPMILMPALIVGMGKFIEWQMKKSEEQTIRIAFANEENAQDLSDIIRKQENVQIVSLTKDKHQAIEDNDADLIIEYPNNFRKKVSNQESVDIQIVFNSLNSASPTAVAKVQIAVNEFNTNILKERFSKQNIQINILSNVLIQKEDTATEQEIGGFGLGFILPLFIIMWSIVGGQYTAIDVSAGEKERKTLESLLLTPAKRIHIIIGKYLAVVTAALISVVISISSMYFAISTFGFGIDDGSNNTNDASSSISFDMKIEFEAILILFIVSVLLVLMFSATLLSISIFAKSYKEAQSYIGPSYLIIILPVTLVNSIPGFKAALWIFSIPAVNAIVLFKEVLVGEYIFQHIALTILSLIIFASIALLAATKIYQKEGVLFRE